MTADPGDRPAPTAAAAAGRRPCFVRSDTGHHYVRAADGTRVWVCRGCGRRKPFHTDGASA